MRTEIENMDQCLDNVHLYENRDENEKNVTIDQRDAENLHRGELVKYRKPILPYHERGESSSASRCQSASKKIVTFED